MRKTRYSQIECEEQARLYESLAYRMKDEFWFNMFVKWCQEWYSHATYAHKHGAYIDTYGGTPTYRA